MEIKIVFEIEEGSKQVIGDFSKALAGLGKRPVVRELAGSIKYTAELAPHQNKGEPVKVPKEAETPVEEAEKEIPAPAESKEENAAPTEASIEKEPKTKKTAKKKTDPVPTVKAEYTRGDLARVGRELSLAGKTEDILAAFAKFNAVSLAEIKPENYSELAQIYIELGGKF